MRRPEYWDWILSATSKDDPSKVEADPYALASSFYGPGVILGWYMICLSCFIRVLLDTNAHRAGRNIHLSADLVAMLLYPAIAAGHLLFRLVQYPPKDRWRLLIMLADLAVSPRTPQDDKYFSWVGNAEPPTVTAFQHSVAVEGPLRVLQNFLFVRVFLALAVFTACKSVKPLSPTVWNQGIQRRRKGPAGWLLFAAFWWSWIVLIVLFILGRGIWVLPPYIVLMSVAQTLLLLWIFFIVAGPGYLFPMMCLEALTSREFVLTIIAFSEAAIMVWSAQFLPSALSTVIVPDIGASLRDLDQVAAAIGGAAGLVIMALLDTHQGKEGVKRAKELVRGNLTEMWRRRTSVWGRNRWFIETMPLHLGQERELDELGTV